MSDGLFEWNSAKQLVTARRSGPCSDLRIRADLNPRADRSECREDLNPQRCGLAVNRGRVVFVAFITHVGRRC